MCWQLRKQIIKQCDERSSVFREMGIFNTNLLDQIQRNGFFLTPPPRFCSLYTKGYLPVVQKVMMIYHTPHYNPCQPSLTTGSSSWTWQRQSPYKRNTETYLHTIFQWYYVMYYLQAVHIVSYVSYCSLAQAYSKSRSLMLPLEIV